MNIIFGVVDDEPEYNKFLKKAKRFSVKTKLVTQARYGGGGWPEIQFIGTRANLIRYFVKTKFLNSIQEANEMLDEYGEYGE